MADTKKEDKPHLEDEVLKMKKHHHRHQPRMPNVGKNMIHGDGDEAFHRQYRLVQRH